MIFAIHQHELAISTHVSSPLPPTFLLTPSLQDVTEPWLWVLYSYIKLPLAIYFTYGEKMGNVAHHWRSANQNHKEVGSFFTTAPPESLYNCTVIYNPHRTVLSHCWGTLESPGELLKYTDMWALPPRDSDFIGMVCDQAWVFSKMFPRWLKGSQQWEALQDCMIVSQAPWVSIPLELPFSLSL